MPSQSWKPPFETLISAPAEVAQRLMHPGDPGKQIAVVSAKADFDLVVVGHAKETATSHLIAPPGNMASSSR